ncbi:MAG TPA: hypothetical protein VM582_10000 [Candidatus Thermoplasmatota archaeon]|nr:hypothetical protein [Candidatus Thermoplasmatota archaeon]
MQPFLVTLALLSAGASGLGAPLEIDLLEAYLATGDHAPGLPHCARTHGYLGAGATPEPQRSPAGGTNRILEEHMEFHLQIGDAGRDHRPSTDDADRYGEIFLEWHEYLLGLYQRWRVEHGHPPLAGWNPAEPMPPELAYPYPERACVDGRDDDPRVPWPTWATREGGDEPDPLFGHTRLCDFRDENQFGKSIAGEWHHAWHGSMGGEMSIGHGPRDPAFWAGHQFIVDVTDEWRDHCAGAAAGVATAARADDAREVPGAPLALVVLALCAAALAAGAQRRR